MWQYCMVAFPSCSSPGSSCIHFGGTQAWYNVEFFLTWIRSLYALRKFTEKISLLFLRSSPEFRCSNISTVTEHTRTKFFERYPKIFIKIFTLVLLDGCQDGFSKFWIFVGEICILIRDSWVIFENCCVRMLSMRGGGFVASWACTEPISSRAGHARNACSASGKMWTVFTCTVHAGHARRCFKIEYLGRIRYDFQKSRVTGPWDRKVSVSAKGVKRKVSCLCTFKFP